MVIYVGKYTNRPMDPKWVTKPNKFSFRFDILFLKYLEDRLLGRCLYFGSPSKSWRCRFEIGDLGVFFFLEDFEISGGFWNRCRPAVFLGTIIQYVLYQGIKHLMIVIFLEVSFLSERPLVAFCMKFFFCQTFASKDMKKYFAKVRALKPEVSWFSSSNSQSLSPCFCGSFQPNSCALAQKKKHEEKGTRGVMCCDLLVLSGNRFGAILGWSCLEVRINGISGF